MEVLLASCVGALNPTVLWSENYFDNSHNILASGDNTYVASGESGALIYDVSVPASPKLLGACRTRGEAYDVAIKVASGNVKGITLLYVADDTMGMSVCDVTDPSSPKVIGTYDCPLLGCNAWDVEVVGNTVYLGDYRGKKVHIVDVADPTTPTLVGTYTAADRVNDVAVYNSFMYVAVGDDGLEVVNVANRVSPTRVSRYPSIIGRGTPSAGSVIVKDNVAYLGTFDAHGVEMVDVSNPASPVFMGRHELAGRVSDLALWGTTLYVAAETGLVVLDVGDPASITKHSVYTQSGARGVTFRGSVVHMACLQVALVSISVGNPSTPSLVSSLGKKGNARKVHVSGNLAVVTDNQNDEARLYDVSDPSDVKLMSTIVKDSATVSIIHGSYLFLGFFGGVSIYDISRPTAPVDVGFLEMADRPVYTLRVERALLFVSNFAPGIVIYDVSEPRGPVELGTCSLLTAVFSVAVSGNTLWFTSSSGLRTYDIYNPRTPVAMDTTFVAGDATDIVVTGTVAYLAAGDGGLQIFDVSNQRPVPKGYYHLENAVALSVEGDTVYVADDNNGLYIFDVSNLDAPKLLKHMLVDGSARDVFAVGTTVYMADYGLRIIDAAPEVITPEPTPAPTPVPTPAPTPAPTPEPTSEPLTDTEAPTTPAPQTPTEDDSSSDNALDDVPFWAWILIGVAVGACLGALIVFCACKKGDNPKSTPYP